MGRKCQDCNITNNSVTLCQGDLVICSECNFKRFGVPVQRVTSASKLKSIVRSPINAIRDRLFRTPHSPGLSSNSDSTESLNELIPRHSFNVSDVESLPDYLMAGEASSSPSNQGISVPNRSFTDPLLVDSSQTVPAESSQTVPADSSQTVPMKLATTISASKARKQIRKQKIRPTSKPREAPATRRSTRNTGSSSQTTINRVTPTKDSPTKPKPRKAKNSQKVKANTPAKKTDKVILRCGLCMLWFTSEDTEAGAWVCEKCRSVPTQITTLVQEMSSLRTIVSAFQETIKDLARLLAAKTAQCEELLRENQMLQQQTNHVNPPIPSPMGSLVIGDSIIKNIDQDKLIDTKVISMGGACVDDIKRRCLQMKDKFKDITIVVGTNNCDCTQDAESTISDFSQLLQAGHDRAQKVTVSSICPPIDISDIQDPPRGHR